MKRTNITISEKANRFIQTIRESSNDELVMFVGSGCCEGPVPQLFKKSETIIPSQHETVYKNNLLTIYFIQPITYHPDLHYFIDLKTNVINDSFSIESQYDCQFVLQIKDEK